MKTLVKSELWVNHKLEEGGRKFFNLWINDPKASGPTGPWVFKDTAWANDEADAIEIAKERFGLNGQYKAYEQI